MSGGSPSILSRIDEIRAEIARRRADGERIGFVPTMGALHEGHLSLVRLAREHADTVVVSIFVNPAQFAPTEDLDRYPRQLARDVELLAQTPARIVFAPAAQDVYLPGDSTRITIGGVGEGLETTARPHFFTGVATVVAKLFAIVAPDIAVFGEKDYQQLQVIKRLVTDLHLPVEIVPGPTIRESDGLALSSRNQYLSPDERRTAAGLSDALREAVAAARAGTPSHVVEAAAVKALTEKGFGPVDYVAVRDAETLGPLADGRPGRILAAAWLGRTRLIDNMAV